MKKRVFSYDKWANDSEVQDTLFHYSTAEYKQARHETMRELDGAEVDIDIHTKVGYVRDRYNLLTLVKIEWTDPVEKNSILPDILMVLGGALAVYGLAMLCQNLKDLLCSMV